MAMALLFGLLLASCNPRRSRDDDVAPTPLASGTQVQRVDPAQGTAQDSTAVSLPTDSTAGVPDTSAATPPISPPSRPGPDSAPAPAEPGKPGEANAESGGLKVSRLEYEGWRQYSVHCARCHGQDALPNPVAANLLISLAPNGPIQSSDQFAEIVATGRPASGMPGFKGILSPAQITAIYAYVEGRAEGRIPPGRPDRPEA